jgi:hypothetical protein
MDLLACSQCEHRFYVNGANSPEGLWCQHCGGALRLALHHISSIPLDARWLDPHSAIEAPESTIVGLRRKRERAGRTSKRIVRDLADYFEVRAHGRSLEVRVNRGVSQNAALRVAAVLDGVDSDWEDHFYLPTVDSEESAAQMEPPQQRRANHLRLVPWRNEREMGSA